MLVVIAAVVQQLGAALAVTIFPTVGAVGIVASRFLVASVVLCILVRPRVRALSRRHWLTVVGLAVAMTSLSLLFYSASGRVPLGVAVTIEVCGPLVLSVVTSNRRSAWLWALMAFTGIVALAAAAGNLGDGRLPGYLFAAGAATAWAAYIMASSVAGPLFPGLDALAIATTLGALVMVPVAAASGTAHATDSWPVLGTVIVVAFASTVIPHSMELVSLRRLPPSTFAVLTCLSPVFATVIGRLALGQQLSTIHYLAIALVTTASIGAVAQSPRRGTPSTGPPPNE